MRLFIDTDIGDDIDDALAIAMAVGAGADIVGVTTATRECERRLPKSCLRCREGATCTL